MRLLWFLSASLALHSAVGATIAKERRAGTSPTVLTPQFVQTVQGIIDAGAIPGLTVGIVSLAGGPPELGAWGINSENGTNMTTDTLFNVADLSKAFLTASLGIVIDDFAHGRNTTALPAGLSNLTWTTKMADILPNEWKLLDEWASEKANLIDVLTQVTGVASNDYSYKQNDTVSYITGNLRNFRPSYELREQWLNNNQMYMAGAYVVSKLTGQQYTDFVTNRIFKPLGMNSSTYSINEALQTGRFSDTWTPLGENTAHSVGIPRLVPPWIQEEFVDLVAGTAGVISCAEDMTLWLGMILNGGVDPVSNVTIIPSAQFKVITQAHSIVNSSDVSAQESTNLYGLGWHRDSYEGHDVLVHNGDAPGVTTFIAAALEDGVGFIVLANADTKDAALVNITLTAAAIAFGSEGSSSSPSAASRRSKLPRHASLTARADGSGETLAPPNVNSQVGTYYNPGYGSMELCSVNSTSTFCTGIVADFFTIDKTINSTTPDLFAAWPALLSTHLRFVYHGNDSYIMYIGFVYPEGYGKNTSSFGTPIFYATTEFVEENGKVVGFGWNTFANAVERTGSLEETFDVYFNKVA